MVTFKIDRKEYGYKILAGTYEVNRECQYSEWVDARYRKHRTTERNEIKGRFDMFFSNLKDYHAFLTELEKVKELDNSYRITLSVNNSNEDYTGNFFIEFSPSRNRKENLVEYMEQFTVSIEEA